MVFELDHLPFTLHTSTTYVIHVFVHGSPSTAASYCRRPQRMHVDDDLETKKRSSNPTPASSGYYYYYSRDGMANSVHGHGDLCIRPATLLVLLGVVCCSCNMQCLVLS